MNKFYHCAFLLMFYITCIFFLKSNNDEILRWANSNYSNNYNFVLKKIYVLKISGTKKVITIFLTDFLFME